jgi:hypothetical protein
MRRPLDIGQVLSGARTGRTSTVQHTWKVCLACCSVNPPPLRGRILEVFGELRISKSLTSIVRQHGSLSSVLFACGDVLDFLVFGDLDADSLLSSLNIEARSQFETYFAFDLTLANPD